MLKFLKLLIIASLFLSFVSCDDDDGGTPPNYVGIWSSTVIETSDCDDPDNNFSTDQNGCFDTGIIGMVCVKAKLTLNADKTGVNEFTTELLGVEETETDSFTYSVMGDIITYCPLGEPVDSCMNLTFMIDGDQMTATDDADEDGCVPTLIYEKL